MMSRRGFIGWVAGLIFSGHASASRLDDGVPEKRVLRTHVGFPAGDIFSEFALDYVKLVNSLSCDSLCLKTFDKQGAVSGLKVLHAVHRGSIDASIGVAGSWSDEHPALALFGTAPPFGWATNDVLAWMHHGGGESLYRELINHVLKLNVVSYMFGPLPSQPLGWFRREIGSIEEMRRGTYRTVGLSAQVNRRMGVNVKEVPGRELPHAIQSGKLDGAEFNNPVSDRRLGLPSVAKVYMMQSYHQPCECLEAIFNKRIHDALPQGQQNMLRVAADAISANIGWKASDLYSSALAEMESKQEVRTARTPQDVLEAQLTAWDRIIAGKSKDPFFKKVVESQKQWARRVVGFKLRYEVDQRMAYEHNFGPLK